jgi:hypothetical protein
MVIVVREILDVEVDYRHKTPHISPPLGQHAHLHYCVDRKEGHDMVEEVICQGAQAVVDLMAPLGRDNHHRFLGLQCGWSGQARETLACQMRDHVHASLGPILGDSHSLKEHDYTQIKPH